MRSIKTELTDELLNHFKDPINVGSMEPYHVETFRELVEHTAKLSFKNKDHLIFYRGQSNDFKNRAGNSSFYPSIYRGGYITNHLLDRRFDILKRASKELVNMFENKKIEGYKELKRKEAVQWSVLQHYEVCKTPYLDFTHSLRVACSFATLDNNEDYAYIFVFGLPYLTNRITINSEHDLINVRLLSICPPTALRPYFQEGYIAGTYDITTQYDSKSELDFNNRLIAKFRIPNLESFWGKGFDQIPKDSLYPKDDPISELCQTIKFRIKTDKFLEYLINWDELEEIIMAIAIKQNIKFSNVRETLKLLFERGCIEKNQLNEIDRLRTFRYTLVQFPDEVKSGQFLVNLMSLIDTLDQLKATYKSA